MSMEMVEILASFALKFVCYQAHGFADMMEKVDAPIVILLML